MSIRGVGALLRPLVPLWAIAVILASCGGNTLAPPSGDAGDVDGAGIGPGSASSSGGGLLRDSGSHQDATSGPASAPNGDGGGARDATLSSDASATSSSDGGFSCDASGTCGCPPYETLCNGACIVTNLDPNNCGACGRACAAGQACSAGVCSSTCTTPTNGGSVQIIKCGQACVDMWTDNRNCGGCGVDCTTSNEVCVGGTCVAPTISLDGGTKSCPGGGPLIDITTSGATKTCVGTLAQTTFRFGLCTCGNVSLVNSGQSWPGHPGLNFPALYMDAYDSSKGPWDPNAPQLGGSLGVNGTFRSAGGASTLVTGHWWNASSMTVGGITDVKQELHAGSSVASSAAVNVGQPNSAPPPPTVPVIPGTAAWDGYVTGAINASAPMTFYKNLFVPPGAPAPAGVVFQGVVASRPPRSAFRLPVIPAERLRSRSARSSTNTRPRRTTTTPSSASAHRRCRT